MPDTRILNSTAALALLALYCQPRKPQALKGYMLSIIETWLEIPLNFQTCSLTRGFDIGLLP